MRDDLLLVADRSDGVDECFSYALNLARVTRQGITILLALNGRLSQRDEHSFSFANLTDSVTQDATLGACNSYGAAETRSIPQETLAWFIDGCRRADIVVSVRTSPHDVFLAVRNMIREKANVGMVLLSPGVMADTSVSKRSIDRLARAVSRPVVAISHRACIA